MSQPQQITTSDTSSTQDRQEVLATIINNGALSQFLEIRDVSSLSLVCRSTHQAITNIPWLAYFGATREEFQKALTDIHQNPDHKAIAKLLLGGYVTIAEAIELCTLIPKLPEMRTGFEPIPLCTMEEKINRYALALMAEEVFSRRVTNTRERCCSCRCH